jgi:hypothetical protein
LSYKARFKIAGRSFLKLNDLDSTHEGGSAPQRRSTPFGAWDVEKS